MKFTTENSPWLSIVIPIYNAEKHLIKCIDSILNQTFTDFELLLVDDGSTDSSPDICKKYASEDSRIRYFRKENGGCFQTRIYGIERTRGQYVTNCDADDYYTTKNAFKIIYETTKKYRCSMVQFGFVKKFNHLKQSFKFVNQQTYVEQNEFLSKDYPILLCNRWETTRLTGYAWNKAYKRSLLTNLPDSQAAEKVFFGEDIIFNLYALAKAESVVFIPEKLYTYRQFSGGTSYFARQKLDVMDIIKKYQLVFLSSSPEDQKEEIEKRLFEEIAGWFYFYVCQLVTRVSEEETKELISEALELPRVQIARRYYLETNDGNVAIDLLRKAEPDEYIRSAKASSSSKQSTKSKIMSVAKEIYKKI